MADFRDGFGGAGIEQLCEVFFSYAVQPYLVAQALPHGREHRMQQRAAVHRIESGQRRIQAFGAKAMARKGAEGASRLVLEHHGSTLMYGSAVVRGCGYERRRIEVGNRFDMGCEVDHVAQSYVRRDPEFGRRRFGDAFDQWTGQQFAILFALRMAQHDFRRGAKPALRNAPIQLQRGRRIRVGYAGFALQADGHEWIGAQWNRPGVLGEPGYPEMLELQMIGFQRTQDLDRHVFGLGLEQGVRCHAREPRTGLSIAHAPGNAIEGGKRGDYFVPFL